MGVLAPVPCARLTLLVTLIATVNLAAGYRILDMLLIINIWDLIENRYFKPFDPYEYGWLGERAEEDLWIWIDLWVRTQIPLFSALLIWFRRRFLMYIALFLQIPFYLGLLFSLILLISTILHTTIFTPPSSFEPLSSWAEAIQITLIAIWFTLPTWYVVREWLRKRRARREQSNE